MTSTISQSLSEKISKKALDLKKSPVDLILFLLFSQSLVLFFLVNNQVFYWLFSLVFFLTIGLLGRKSFNINLLRPFGSDKSYDFFFIFLLAVLLNANLPIFSNLALVVLILAGTYLGIRYFIHIINFGATNQIRKNSVILMGTLAIFLGANFLTNVTIVTEKYTGQISSVLTSAILFMLIFFISYYNFLKSTASKKWSTIYSAGISLIAVEIMILSRFFIEKYPNIYKTATTNNLSITTTALFLVLTYYCVFGLMIHKIENRLSAKIIFEYIGITLVILTTLIFTTKWFN